MKLVLIVATVLITLYNVYAIGPVCPPKGFFNCTEKATVELQCRFTVVINSCTNCWTCPKDVNETCGGFWNHAGICNSGLECVKNSNLGMILIELPGICQKSQ